MFFSFRFILFILFNYLSGSFYKPSIYLSTDSHCVFPVDIKYRICVYHTSISILTCIPNSDNESLNLPDLQLLCSSQTPLLQAASSLVLYSHPQYVSCCAELVAKVIKLSLSAGTVSHIAVSLCHVLAKGGTNMIKANCATEPRRPFRGCGRIFAGLLPYLDANWHLAWHVRCQNTKNSKNETVYCVQSLWMGSMISVCLFCRFSPLNASYPGRNASCESSTVIFLRI